MILSNFSGYAIAETLQDARNLFATCRINPYKELPYVRKLNKINLMVVSWHLLYTIAACWVRTIATGFYCEEIFVPTVEILERRLEINSTTCRSNISPFYWVFIQVTECLVVLNQNICSAALQDYCRWILSLRIGLFQQHHHANTVAQIVRLES
jgi:hypothetical protein